MIIKATSLHIHSRVGYQEEQVDAGCQFCATGLPLWCTFLVGATDCLITWLIGLIHSAWLLWNAQRQTLHVKLAV